MTEPETAALDVECPICGVPPGDLCQDVVRGHIGPVERPHLYRTSRRRGGVAMTTTTMSAPRTENIVVDLDSVRSGRRART